MCGMVVNDDHLDSEKMDGIVRKKTRHVGRRKLKIRRLKSSDGPQCLFSIKNVCKKKRRSSSSTSRGDGDKVSASSSLASAEKGVGEVCAHGWISVCGRRRVMEDAVTVVPEWLLLSSAKFDFFAVYDGHGGAGVAHLCRDRLHRLLAKEIDEVTTTSGDDEDQVDWEKVMWDCFSKMDEEVNRGGMEVEEDMKSIGSTAVVALVGMDKLIVANCGDSRAVLSRQGVAVPLSLDHKPDRPDEMERIEAAGGRVINWNGYRVLGVLATSRSIGDHYLKPYVISVPEVTVTKLTENEEFLILASDGLWDVMSNEVACEVVRRCFDSRMGSSFSNTASGCGAVEAAAVLAELAMARGSKDNISIVVIDLNKQT